VAGEECYREEAAEGHDGRRMSDGLTCGGRGGRLRARGRGRERRKGGREGRDGRARAVKVDGGPLTIG
jgi:hypothetical protein